MYSRALQPWIRNVSGTPKPPITQGAWCMGRCEFSGPGCSSPWWDGARLNLQKWWDTHAETMRMMVGPQWDIGFDTDGFHADSESAPWWESLYNIKSMLFWPTSVIIFPRQDLRDTQVFGLTQVTPAHHRVDTARRESHDIEIYIYMKR